MKRLSNSYWIISFLFLLAFWACEPDKYPTEFVEDEVVFVLKHSSNDTRSSYGDDVDQLFTGAELAVYNSTTGVLELQRHILPEELNSNITVRLLRGYQYNFYVLGNLYKVHKRDGIGENIDIPYTEEEMKNYLYRLDGSDIDSDYRYERLEEVSRYGIPLSWKCLNLNPFAQGKVDIEMRRLFSRLRLVIDHRGLSGSSLSDFINGKVYIRQVNARLTPFFDAGSKASGPDDVIPQGDYELSMDNDNGREYVFYVPENMQGDLLPSNIDPQQKNQDVVISSYGESLAKSLTYLEFQGRLNGDAGYTGDAIYRFYLGENNTSNFDVEGNVDRRVDLSFNPNSIFNASWKVSYDDLQDQRQFYLSGDRAGKLPDGQKIVVRPSRPGHFNLNIELPGAVNKISDARHVDPDYQPNSLTDFAWTSNCLSLSHNPNYETKRSELDAAGVSCSYSSGKMSFYVSNPERFVPGKEIPIEVTFFPGGHRLSAIIVTQNDISVKEINGLSTSSDFYVAQKRTLQIENFNGDEIYYSAVQSPCGPSGDVSSINRQWKTSNNLTDGFPQMNAEDAGNQQKLSLGQGLDIYAFYPNQSKNLSGFVSGAGKIVISSNDIHNDDVVEIPVSISMPYYAGVTQSSSENIKLLVDGQPCALNQWFYTADGGIPLSKSKFDADLYKALLYPQVKYSDDCSPWIKHCVDIDDENSSIYLARTTLSGVNIEDVEFSPTMADVISFESNPTTGLLPYKSSQLVCSIKQPTLPESVSDYRVLYFDEYKQADSKFGFGVFHNYYEVDPTKIKMSLTGPSNDYICADGTIIKPVIDIFCGNSTISWEYKESHQTTQTASGEKVPGAVVVPYGPQTLSMVLTNQHDGRELIYSCTFTIRYNITLAPIPVYPSSGDASVYMMSSKNFKYLKQLAPSMTKEQRRWMVKALGSDTWTSQIASTDDFRCIIDGTSTYPAGRGTKYSRLPRTGYKASYVDPSARNWTIPLAEKVLSDGNYYTIHEPFFFAEEDGSNFVTEDPSITGNQYMKLSVASMEKQGYIFMDNF